MLRFVGGLVMLTASIAVAFNSPGLRSRFGTACTVEKDCFIGVARTVTEAKAAGWVQPKETLNNTLFSTFCQEGNGRICTLYDSKESIAGYQISIPAAVRNQNQPGLDYIKMGFKELQLFGESFFSNQIYFIDQETLKAGGRDFNGTTAEGLWLQTGKDLISIPPFEKDMPGNTSFIRQNCMLRMGQHWFWNATKQMEPEGFLPWFILYNQQGELHGFGFISFGSDIDENFTSWFENVSLLGIIGIAPDTPQWVLDYTTDYGIFAHHVYFGEEPWNISC